MLLHRDEELCKRGTSHIVSPAAISMPKEKKKKRKTSSYRPVPKCWELWHAPSLINSVPPTCSSPWDQQSLSAPLMSRGGIPAGGRRRWDLPLLPRCRSRRALYVAFTPRLVQPLQKDPRADRQGLLGWDRLRGAA